MPSTIGHRSIAQFHFFINKNHKNDPPVPTFEHVVVKLAYTRATARYPGRTHMGGPAPLFSSILGPHTLCPSRTDTGGPSSWPAWWPSWPTWWPSWPAWWSSWPTWWPSCLLLLLHAVAVAVQDGSRIRVRGLAPILPAGGSSDGRRGAIGRSDRSPRNHRGPGAPASARW